MTDHCDVQIFVWVWTKLLPLHGCDVMRFGVMCLWFDLLSSDVASCEVICGTTPVLLCTTKTYNVLRQYYKVLLQFYSSTTKYYASATKYYSSTTLYYKVLRQYYNILRQNYSVLQSTTPVLLQYYKVLLQYYSSNPRIKSSSRTRRFGDLTRPSLETILYCKIQHFASQLSPKMSRSAAPVTKSHPPTSPNTAPATQNDPPTSPNSAPATQNQCHQWSASHMKRHFQCAEPVKSPSNLTKYCACHEILKVKICAEIPEVLPPIERRFDHNPRISDDIRR